MDGAGSGILTSQRSSSTLRGAGGGGRGPAALTVLLSTSKCERALQQGSCLRGKTKAGHTESGCCLRSPMSSSLCASSHVKPTPEGEGEG